MNTRRAFIRLYYGDVDISSDISDFLLDFTYGDNGTGNVDDLQITLEDSQQLWQGEWAPFRGDALIASIIVTNWTEPGSEEEFYCGSFEIDEVNCAGPPDTIQMKAVSIPIYSTARFEKKSRSWEKVKLSTIARDIASKSGLTLVYELPDDPVYDREEQTDQSDLAFLQQLALKEGAAMKLTDSQLVLFDEQVFEQEEPVFNIVRGQSNVLSYSFNFSAADAAYIACEVSYYDPKKAKHIRYTFQPPNAPEYGPVLTVNEKVSSQAEAERLAKKRLREKNKEANRAKFVLVGNLDVTTGVTFEVSGWKQFDGKYIVISARHQVGGGAYTTELEARLILEGGY